VTTARDEVLRRIRAATAAGPPAPAVPRDYRTTTTDPEDAAVVERFAARVDDYRATVHRVALPDLPARVAALVGDARVAVPDGLPAAWVGDLSVNRDEGRMTTEELDRLDAVVTGCAVAIAETGTIVLDGRADQGRRALTLVPDHHICIVPEGRIVGTVPEGLARLDPLRPLTLISGPSATSDIELDRVEGVHGPRRLDVVILVDAADDPAGRTGLSSS
jgi:L-lactate dehydrogenase complex protein LldG